ncbi:uncharacterized protein LOC143251463 isoform X2 [Tachypleus tridentatus]
MAGFMIQVSVFLSLLCLIVSPVLTYNDDKPIYKWSPLYFRNLKKNLWNFSCATENTECGLERFSYGLIIRLRCCGALECHRVGVRHICLKPWSWKQTNDVY